MPAIAGSTVVTNTNSPFVLGGSVLTKSDTLVSGQNLTAYTTVGRIAASGKLTKAIDSAVDGSQSPIGMLVHDVDASAGDKTCQVYVAGKFNKTMVIWDATYTATEQLQRFDRTPIILDTPT